MKVIDMHCDTISELFYRREAGKAYSLLKNDCHIDLERMKKGDYCLQNFALFTELTKHERPFEYCMKLVDLFYTEIAKHEDLIGVVTCYEDIERNRKEGKMSALLTIEEGGVCQGEIAFLRNFYRLGVRMMTLTWNHKNELASPNRIWQEHGEAFFEPDTEHGLTEKGIEFVNEMEALGMIVDVSHLSDAGIEDVFRYTKKPFVASHSNARTVASNPRNLTDDMIRRLSERGGVAGLNYCAAFLYDWKKEDTVLSRVEHMIAHIKHMKQVGGIQCIGLGSDFDGIGGELEMKSPEDLPILEAAMNKAGFTEGEIEAVFYKNVLRVYEEILH
ncbi:dipeptidase [Lacrimispora aerotolerans]|uniref:dipeptidase n=1 Tax=Lacrimispora aerotolerans TaxID=36832 RepID=UPI00047AE6B8|nr:dipeptidase [Lacrimispora aerotolerans]